jgi:hypothetical protein
MNGAHSGTLARLAMASGIIIVQKRFTIGADSWISLQLKTEGVRLD